MREKIDIKKVGLVIVVILLIIFIVSAIIKKNGKIIPLEENRIYENNFFVEYSADENVGVVDKTGKEIIVPEYVDIYIPNPEEPVFICLKENDEYEILNLNGEKIFQNYENVWPLMTSDGMLDFEKEVLKFQRDEKFGLINLKGEEILKPEYDEIESLKYKPGKISLKKGNLYGVADSEGKIIIDIEYDSIEGDGFCTEKEGYTKTGYIIKQKTRLGYMQGYIDCYGRTLLEPEYESVERVLNYNDVDNVYLIEMQNGKKGVYKSSKKIIDNAYQIITYSPSSNIFVAKTSKYYMFFNTTGKQILDSKYEQYTLAGDYISVIDGENNKIFDVNGNYISNTSYKTIKETENSKYLIVVDTDGNYSIMNKNNSSEEKFKNLIYAFDDYFIFANEDNKFGILDAWKGIVVEAKFDSILKIENLNALEARSGENTIIYSRNLHEVLTISGAIVENVNEKYAVVYSNTTLDYLDENGNKISNNKVYDNDLYAVEQNGVWGFANKKGEIIVGPEYDIVTELNEYGFAGINKNGKWGVVDKTGKIVLEPEYEIETYYFPSFIGKTYIEQTDTVHCIKLEQ